MRIIPVVLIKEGHVVQSYGFSEHPIIGRPGATFSRLLDYQADEVIVLDITRNFSSSSSPNFRRDLSPALGLSRSLLDVLVEHSDKLLYPIAAGGGIRSVSDAVMLVQVGGADKVVLNHVLRQSPNSAREFCKELGSQALIASVDVSGTEEGMRLYDYESQSAVGTEADLINLIKSLQDIGFGELFINSVSHDGRRSGYSLELIELATTSTDLPIIICGGLGSPDHAAEVVDRFQLSGLAAANFFHSHEMSYPLLKKKIGEPERIREFSSPGKLIRRDEPKQLDDNRSRIKQVIETAKKMGSNYATLFSAEEVSFLRCKVCLYPVNAATSLSFNKDSVCSGCSRHKEAFAPGTGRVGLERLKSILDQRLSRRVGDYDCVIAVSGGKDSYFQAHFVTETLGLRPLLVTYDANNWTERGLENLHNMKAAFGVDHLIVEPPKELLAKMNLLGLLMVGDMSWHAHVGITSTPMRIASELNIPFVFFGEHGREDMSGQFRFGDFPEITFRERFEHDARGFEWTSFEGLYGITSEDLKYWRYPTDNDLYETELRGLHVGTFVNWDPLSQTELVRQKYGFKTSDRPFERTYRTGSNLDDMHENGLHDWLKYLKFGYGRATDHGSKDIRSGAKERSHLLEVVRRMDSTLPSDIERWLPYAGISRDAFFSIANTFRSSTVWTFRDNTWIHPEGMEDSWGVQISMEVVEELNDILYRVAP